MALLKAQSKALVVAKPKGTIGPEKKKVNVLDEEKYEEEVEKIIEEDFFPELPKMKAQREYFEALEKNDLVKLRELQIKYSKRPDTGRSIYSSPATFETPEHRDRVREKQNPDTGQEEPPLSDSTDNNKKPTGVKQHLDSFLSKNTSEDDDSFAAILRETDNKQREKHAWLYENENSRKNEEENRLALPSVEEQAMITDGQAGVDTWKYKARNSVMYVPEGEDYSTAELLELKKKKPRKIMHEHTRFSANPWNNQKNKAVLKQAASEQALLHSGKIGHDGKEVEIRQSPKVNGYGFVATPSPAPGVEESPLMTWGEIEGTPFQLEPGETPLAPATGAPAFKIPEVPHRDQLAMELAEKASKQHRDKKENALKLASRLASPVAPGFGSGRSSTDRINSLSPAAQRLFGNRIGIRTGTDKALRASYSPSPSRLPGERTPILSKSTPKNRTPSGKTPVITPGSGTPGQATPSGQSGSSALPSLTDNLLQIPKKRSKATADQFPNKRQKATDDEEPEKTQNSMDGQTQKKRPRATDFF